MTLVCPLTEACTGIELNTTQRHGGGTFWKQEKQPKAAGVAHKLNIKPDEWVKIIWMESSLADAWYCIESSVRLQNVPNVN